MTFRLPPEITVSKQRLSSGWSYVFRHQELGNLGRMLLQGTGGGQTYISCEVAGDPDDPMTKKRQAILEPITRELADAMEHRTGPGFPEPAPVQPQQPKVSKLT